MPINSVADFIRALSDGPYAWPGGYPKYFTCDDGEALSFKAAEGMVREISEAIENRDHSGWRVVGVDINWEDVDLFCVHTGERIPSAYGEA